MAKQQLRDHINLIKRKLTELKDMNDDIINEIIGDVKALTNFKIDAEPTKISKKKKQIKQDKPKTDNTQYYKIDDEPETEKKQKPKNEESEFIILKGCFEVDLGME